MASLNSFAAKLVVTGTAILFFQLVSGVAAATSKQPLVMSNVEYANEYSVTNAVRDQCDFANTLTNEIRSVARSRGTKIEYVETNEGIAPAAAKLVVTVARVEATEWLPMNFRPASSARIQVAIVVNGATVMQFEDHYRSFSTGIACVRLNAVAEKAANAVNKWASKAKY